MQSVTTLRAVLDIYLAPYRKLATETRRYCRGMVERCLASWLDRPLREITPEIVNASVKLQWPSGHQERPRRLVLGARSYLVSGPFLGVPSGDGVAPNSAIRKSPIEPSCRASVTPAGTAQAAGRGERGASTRA
jgi:hypothetical protein